MTQGYPPVALNLMPRPEGMRRVAVALNHQLQGKLNVIKSVTLAANAASTTISDPRLSGQTALLFGPLTANAAVCKPTIWYDTKTNGSVVVHHLNSPAADKTFDVIIIG